MSTKPYSATPSHHRIEASARVTFDPDHQPLVSAKTGAIRGCVFALKALTVTVTAQTVSDGEVIIYTHAVPDIARLVHDNGDNTDHSHWRFLTVPESDYPSEVQPTLRALREAVHAIHPGLTLDTRCPECAGLNGEHGLVHARYPEGGGGTNRPCSRAATDTTSAA